MGKNRRKVEKRKKSSDSSELEKKITRHGGSPGVVEKTVSTLNCKNRYSCLSEVSDLIRESSSILYSDSDTLIESETVIEQNNSVFENVVSPNKNINMASHNECRSNPGISMSSDQSAVLGVSSDNELRGLLQIMNSRLERIDKKLERLDEVEKKVDRFDADLKKLQSFMTENYNKIETKVIAIEEKIDSYEFSTAMLSDKVEQMKKMSEDAKEELLFIQSQSMRNNIIFTNIPEETRETRDQLESKLRSFLVEKLEIAQNIVDKIEFERIHRMGDRRKGCRQIVAKFLRFKDREMVKKQGSKLKNTQYSIYEQFPKEISDRRKKLLPKLKEARRNGKEAWLSYDKLYIDGVPSNISNQ